MREGGILQIGGQGGNGGKRRVVCSSVGGLAMSRRETGNTAGSTPCCLRASLLDWEFVHKHCEHLHIPSGQSSSASTCLSWTAR